MNGPPVSPARRRVAAQAPRRRSAFASRLVNTAAPGEPPQVLDDLRRAIVSGAEPPGTLIPIDAVAEFFAVSHIPVREALKVLTAEGLVDHVPHVGYSVSQLTFTEFRELYEVRQALEAAALRSAVRHATELDDMMIRLAHDEVVAALAAQDDAAFHVASRRFHMALLAPARMERLLRMYESAWNLTEAVRPMARVAADDRRLLCGEHDSLVNAFVARDAERLVAASVHHFEHLKQSLEQFSDDPTVFRPEG